MKTSNKYLFLLPLIFSLVSTALSIITICSISDHSFCTDSALLSIAGVIVATLVGIVTILIAWQIFNYFSLENRIKDITNNSINSFILDFNNYNNAITAGNNDVDYVTDTPNIKGKSIVAYIEGFKKALLCKNDLMRKAAINYIMDRVLNNNDSEINQNNDQKVIPQGKRNEFLRVLKGVEHDNIDILIDYVMNAIELDKKGNQ